MSDPRLRRFLEAADGDVLVSADAGIVRMLSGHAADVGTGPSPFALPPVVVAPGDGPARLVCSQDEAPQSDNVHAYEGFTTAPLDPVGGAGDALAAALAAAGKGRVLVDDGRLPAALLARVPQAVTAPRTALRLLTAVKTENDVEAVAAAIRLCDAGQAAARAATREGIDELDLWRAVTAAVERAAGGRVTMIADLVSGERCEDVGGAPTPRRISSGEAVLADLVPMLDGVWGDSCATWTVGEPDEETLEMHRAACEALELGLDALRPGAVAGDVDRLMREALAAGGHTYPHHSGHGLGFGWHEEPRIVPGSPTVLEPGMVVALEPGSYGGGRGVRVEQVAVVTSAGPRVLSQHSLEIQPNGSTDAQ